LITEWWPINTHASIQQQGMHWEQPQNDFHMQPWLLSQTSLAWLRSALTLVSESWGDVSPVLSLVANKADVSWAPDGKSGQVSL
jgi:hypothetical protein